MPKFEQGREQSAKGRAFQDGSVGSVSCYGLGKRLQKSWAVDPHVY